MLSLHVTAVLLTLLHQIQLWVESCLLLLKKTERDDYLKKKKGYKVVRSVV